MIEAILTIFGVIIIVFSVFALVVLVYIFWITFCTRHGGRIETDEDAKMAYQQIILSRNKAIRDERIFKAGRGK